MFNLCLYQHVRISMSAYIKAESTNISNLKRPASSREGITCSVCHRVNKSYGKISGRLPLVRGPMHSTIFGPSGGDEVDRVIADTDKKGFKEYGVTVDREDYTLRDWLQEAYEETCDTAKYLKAAIEKIDKNK